MMLAKLTLAELPRVEHAVIKCVPYFSTALALFLMSFPNEYYDWAPWSRQLLKLASVLLLFRVEVGRAWPDIGARILCYSICFSHSCNKHYPKGFPCGLVVYLIHC